jgi:hypothetical protein
MLNNIMLGLSIVALVFFVILACMGTTVSAWYVVAFILPEVIHRITMRMYDMT